MQARKSSLLLNIILLTAVTWSSTSFATASGQSQILYTFTGGTDGLYPYGGVTFDTAGNLYGSTFYGGTRTACNGGCGLVYKLTPVAGGGWEESTIHTFGGVDGAHPYAQLVFDSVGNLYGETSGAYDGGAGGSGTVYELSPAGDGSWKETILYTFSGGNDGADPAGGVVFDAAGNLYGTASSGGAHSDGVVFKLTPKANGEWKETLLHTFSGGRDGSGPGGTSVAPLILDSAGNMYGTTEIGGLAGFGVIFELSNPSGNGWKETVLHEFTGLRDGAYPTGLTVGPDGNMYGGTGAGGDLQRCGFHGCGVLYLLAPNASGSLQEIVLHSFDNNDGASPASLVFDAARHLYGITYAGGRTANVGTAFEFSPPYSGETGRVLYFFNAIDGGTPSGVVLGSDGNLYGTGSSITSLGVVWEIVP
jgi:uncharacterized repeat protein (TIGR03803 family)